MFLIGSTLMNIHMPILSPINAIYCPKLDLTCRKPN